MMFDEATMPKPTKYDYDVFISYSHADEEWVKDKLLSQLEQGGLKVNIDSRDFEIGVPSLVNMERAVDNSRHTLAVLTPAYVTSEWTEFEGLLVGTIDPAGRQRKLFPLMLKPCQPPPRIRLLSYADFTKPAHHAMEFVRLLKQLQGTASVAPPANTERARPARGGDSISNDNGGGATLGCLVVDRRAPKRVYILSDFNAICDLHGPSRAGDPVLQPGRVDGGNRANDLIATLSRWASVRDDDRAAASNISAAIAEVRSMNDVSPEIRERGFLKDARAAAEGMPVWIVGRTGGQVSGTVLRVGAHDRVPCSYQQIEGGVRSTGSGATEGQGFHPIPFDDLIECTYMLRTGDSGAILVDEENHAVGLGFAGSAETSLFIPIQKVLDALKVDLVTERIWASRLTGFARRKRKPSAKRAGPGNLNRGTRGNSANFDGFRAR